MSTRALLLIGTFALLAALPGPSGAGDGFKSGPQKGETVPGSFNPYNINGDHGKRVENGITLLGRHHCLVCEFDLRPVVAVFAREPKDEKLFMDLLKQIDQALGKDKEAGGTMRSFYICLSPYGTDSVIEATLPEEKRNKDPEKLIEIALGRKVLIDKLEQRAAQFKHIVLAYFIDEGPKNYKIDPKAEITILLYENFKVHANFAFEENQITPVSIEEIMKAVNNMVGKTKVKPADEK